MSLTNVAVFMQATFLFFHGEEEGRVDEASLLISTSCFGKNMYLLHVISLNMMTVGSMSK